MFDDLFEIFERDRDDRGQAPAGTRRRGIRGLLDRILGGSDQSSSDAADADGRARRERRDREFDFDD